MHNTNWADQMKIEIIGLVMVHKGDLQINTEEICAIFFYSFAGLQFAIYVPPVHWNTLHILAFLIFSCALTTGYFFKNMKNGYRLKVWLKNIKILYV